MFITRASRHDKPDISDFYSEHDWTVDEPESGSYFFARDGSLVGALRVIEVAPQTVIIEDVLVKEGRRGEGIGQQLMQAALNSRGGSMFLCCHAETIGFYERFGFSELPENELPPPVHDFMERTDALNTDPGHVHHFMKAR